MAANQTHCKTLTPYTGVPVMVASAGSGTEWMNGESGRLAALAMPQVTAWLISYLFFQSRQAKDRPV